MFLATSMFRNGSWPLGLFNYVGNNFEAQKQKAGIYVDQRQRTSLTQKLILMKMKLPSGVHLITTQEVPYIGTLQLQTFKDAAAFPLMTLQLYHPLLPPSPPVSNSSYLFTGCQPLDASCCAVLLYFSRYYTERLNFF